MLIRCPECSTSFSIPEKALGSKGRTLKCARCQHTWHQAPLSSSRDLGLDDSTFPPVSKAKAPPPPPVPDLSAPITADFESALEFALGEVVTSEAKGEPPPELDFKLPPLPEDSLPLRPPLAFPRDALMDNDTPPIRRAKPKPPIRRSGTWGLWLLLILLLLGGGAGLVYHYQDQVVTIVPEVGGVLTDLGLRHEQPGAGLIFRDAGAPERKVIDQTEVLVVYGIIANETNVPRLIPPLQLVLLGSNGETLQSKIDPPPKADLASGATTSFRLIMEKPDPAAVTMNVLFVDPALLPVTNDPSAAAPQTAPLATAPAAIVSPVIDVTPPMPATTAPQQPVPTAKPAPTNGNKKGDSPR